MMKSKIYILATLVAFLFTTGFVFADDAIYQVGAAKINITPDYPVLLHGYGGRRKESEGVILPVFAKALAIGSDQEGLAILISVDNCMVPEHIRAELLKRLAKKGVTSDKFAICSSHTHSAPKLAHVADNIIGMDIPPEFQVHIDRYTKELTDKLEKIALLALKDRKPSTLSWGQTTAGFAANRRTKGGPVDHDVPILKVTGTDGKIRVLLVNYACHCTTLADTPNQICADWAGYAQEDLEKSNPGAIAMTVIGCGADANPAPRPGVNFAQQHGETLTKAVNERLSQPLAPLRSKLECRTEHITLPFDTLPTREEWEKRANDTNKNSYAIVYHAKKNLARLDRGEALPTEIPYMVQTWNFGNELAMVFLPGEVVVDYALRLKKEYDATRLWVNAYANDVPCYIPSKRIWKEGGYEGGGAMVYYDRPTRLAEGTEERIIGAVHAIMPKDYLFDEHKAEFPPPKSPEEALAAFRTKSDLVVDLVASEPLIVDPVAIDWGADGKLWVVEMRDYPLGLDGNGSAGGRIKVLESTKHDGHYDKATVFYEGFHFPTGLMAWGKGCLICTAPDILYAEDTDGDGKADKVTKLYTGFATHNYQARVNSPRWGLDGWVYFAAGLFGGKIESLKTGKVFDLSGRDFRIHPDSGDFEAVSGLTQQTRVRDDAGHWFGNDNSTLCWNFPMQDYYLRRNLSVTTPDPRISVARDPDPNRLYPTSRTLERFNNPQSANHTTSGCGLEIYRDELLGKDYYENAFECEPVHNMVHRLKLVRDGVTFAGYRAADEQQSEFFSSTDNWFRPVEARTGPDGALWIVDMYRFVIEHPKWIPADMLAKLNVRAGEDKGRIYRIYPRGAKLRPIQDLTKLSQAKLVEALDTPNGITRDLIHRMLAATGGDGALRKNATPDPMPFAKLLHEFVLLSQNSKYPQVRIQALCLLESYCALRPESLIPALNDPDPMVRSEAVRMSEYQLITWPEELGLKVVKMADDADLGVRIQVALSLGEWHDARAGEALGKLAVSGLGNTWLRAAVLSSATPHASQILKALLASSPKLAGRSDMINQLIATAVKSGSDKIPAVVESILPEAGQPVEAWRLTALSSLLEAMGDKPLPEAARFSAVFASAREIIHDSKRDDATREAAIRLLGRSSELTADLPLFAEFLQPTANLRLQKAALDSMQRSRSPEVAKLILADWSLRSPSLRTTIIDALLTRDEWTGELLAALEGKTVSTTEISLVNRQRLAASKNEAIQKRAAAIFESSKPEGRAAVVAKYKVVNDLTGDRAHGAAVFEKNCSSCHAFRGVGHAVGPDLAALHDKPADYLVYNILDPSAVIEPRFINYQVELKDGRTLSGIINGETATSLTLVQGGGAKEKILRSDIAEMRAAKLSLMPEGLEQAMTPQDLADLIAHLKSSSPSAFGSAGPEAVTAARKEFLSAGGATGLNRVFIASEKMDYPSWLGTLPLSHCRQTDGKSKLVWDSPMLPGDLPASVKFRLPVGMGMFSAPAAKFHLRINDQAALDFDVSLNDHTWANEDGSVRMSYAVRENNAEDSNGLLTIEVKSSRLRAGESAKFEVDAGVGQSQRWFGIYALSGK